jgi:hypothetical protein
LTLLRRPGDLVLGAGAVLHPLEVSSPVLYAATDFLEGPTLSPDEKSLHYHKREGSLFVIYRVTRP